MRESPDMHITSASNLFAPAYLTVVERGYAVHKGGDLLVATKGDDTFTAEDPILLLGVIAMAETRGENWTATDQQIDAFLEWFAP
jgi:hypothetical protein